mmetsp:Transcript_7849/g.24230  ORF Transcript_7849/g.24230 Transcript_7849/m.24230 type:complete len:133 (-) Transcript_7849:841-1239(-)
MGRAVTPRRLHDRPTLAKSRTPSSVRVEDLVKSFRALCEDTSQQRPAIVVSDAKRKSIHTDLGTHGYHVLATRHASALVVRDAFGRLRDLHTGRALTFRARRDDERGGCQSDDEGARSPRKQPRALPRFIEV